MRMESKISKEDKAEDRAVSPVIGVILMVAITVILAAVIAAFVLDLGQSSGANPSAGFSYDQSGNDTTVELNTIDRLDDVRFSVDSDCNLPSSGDWDDFDDRDLQVGQSWTFSGNGSVCEPDDITIVGLYDGNEATL